MVINNKRLGARSALERDKRMICYDIWREKIRLTIYARCLGLIFQGAHHVSGVIRSCKTKRGGSTDMYKMVGKKRRRKGGEESPSRKPVLTRPSNIKTASMLVSNSVPLPASRSVVVTGDDHHLRIERNVPLPALRPNEVLVQVKAVAINPCDYKMHQRFPCPGAVDGCDFAGVAIWVGSEVANFGIGDRVCGAVHGSNPLRPESGSFTEYMPSESEFTLKIPAGLSFEQAVGMGVTGLGTLGMALFRTLALPGSLDEPATKPRTVLVHGGSSSVGTMAIQLLRL